MILIYTVCSRLKKKTTKKDAKKHMTWGQGLFLGKKGGPDTRVPTICVVYRGTNTSNSLGVGC